MSILNSTMLGRGECAIQVSLHHDGRVILSTGTAVSTAMIHILPVQMPALIAFLQSCTPAESAEGTR